MDDSYNRKKSIQNATLAVTLITNFVIPFAVTSLNIAVPSIGLEFGASTITLTWIVLSFLLVSAVLAIPFGRIGDIHGRRAILKTGILLFCLASFANILVTSMELFLVFRVIQGVGGAMIFATNIAILVSVFPASRRGTVLGISVASVYIGSAVGPVIGGLLTHAFGWRSVFVAITALSAAAFVTAMARSPKEEDLTGASQKLAVSSLVFFIITFGTFLFGVATLTQNLWSYFILAAGIVLIVLYVRHEDRVTTPVLEVRLFRESRLFSLSILAAVFNYAAVFAVAYLMSIYLQLARGLSADLSGLILIFQPIIQAALSPVAGRLSDKKPPQTIASIGMACCAAALFMFVFLSEQTHLAYIIAGLLLVGFGIAFFSSPNSNVILGSVSDKDYGLASSMISTARTFGQVIGMALLTIIVHAVIGNLPIAEVAPAEIIFDLRISFIVFAVICVVGVFISLKRKGE